MIALVRHFFINYLQLISIFWKIAYLRFVIKIPKTVTIKADKKNKFIIKKTFLQVYIKINDLSTDRDI